MTMMMMMMMAVTMIAASFTILVTAKLGAPAVRALLARKSSDTQHAETAAVDLVLLPPPQTSSVDATASCLAAQMPCGLA